MIALLALLVAAELPARCDGDALLLDVGELVLEARGETLLLRDVDVLSGSSPVELPAEPRVLLHVGGDGWIIDHGVIRTPVTPPRALRGRRDLVRLGQSDAAIWLAAPGNIAAVSLTALGTAFHHRLAGSRDAVLPLAIDETGLTALAGRSFLHCTLSGCTELARAPSAPLAVRGSGGRWVIALGGKSGGLYRFESGAARLDLLVSGEVMALCGGSDSAWAHARRGADERLIGVSILSGALRPMAIDEALLTAALAAEQLPEGAALERLVERAVALGGAVLGELAHAAADDERPTTRARAAPLLAALPDARAAAALWVLAHAHEPEVRGAALDAAINRCAGRRALPGCPGLLSAFLDDSEAEIAWSARDALLEYNAAAALEDAPIDYKLDVLPRLMLLADRDSSGELHTALSLLSADENALVRELAATVIQRTVP